MHNSYFFLFYSLLMVLLFFLAVGAYKRSSEPAARSFTVMVTGVVFWLLSNLMYKISTNESIWFFWINMRYLSLMVLNLGWYIFALDITGFNKSSNDWLIRCPFIMAILFLILSITNKYHSLFYRDIHTEISGINYVSGPFDKIAVLYASLIMSSGMFILLRKFLNSKGFKHRHIGILLFGMIPPWTIYIFYRFTTYQIVADVLLPVSITITFFAYYWAVFQLQIFDTISYAYISVADKMSNGIIVLDNQEQIIELNKMARVVLGLENKKELDYSLTDILKERYDLIERIRNLNDGERIVLSHKVDFAVDNFFLKNNRGKIIGRVIIFHDLKEVKEFQLKLLKKEKAVAVMEEREKIARELYDDLCQTLSYIKNQASSIQYYFKQNNLMKASKLLERLIMVTCQTNTNIRDSITSLKSQEKDISFLDKLDTLLANYSCDNQYNFVVLKISGKFALNRIPFVDIGLQLIRIIQEALNNIRKHTDADLIELKLYGRRDMLELVIKDNGCGFDIRRLKEKEGQSFGINIMEERATSTGGSFSIQSGPEKGTTVKVLIPVHLKGDIVYEIVLDSYEAGEINSSRAGEVSESIAGR